MEKGEREEVLCLGRCWKSGKTLLMCLFSQTPKILLCRRDKGSYLVETEQTSLGWGVSLDFDEKNMV